MPLFADRYEIGPVIGRGGMAEVRAGRDTRLERPVALKIMRPEMAHQPLVRERFESEARLAARLIHPNVVSVFDSGEQDGLPYIVMERLPGDTLHDRLAHGPVSEPEARQLALEVLAALETAHAAGILHRDIKPANVLASGDGHWKVADFGIAKALEVDHGNATATGLVLGTPAYLAPERLLGEPATVASDMYALGAVLYEALTGRRPYDDGSGGGWPAVVGGGALVPVAGVRPGVDPVLAGAVERCLARDPSARFWSAAEMSATLGTGGGVVSPAAGPTAVMTAGPATEVLPPPRPGAGAMTMASEWERAPRHPAARMLALLAGLAVLAAVIIAVVADGHSSHGGSPATSRTTAPASSGPTTTAPATTTSTSSTSSTTSSTTSTTISLTITVPGPGGGGPGGDNGPGGGKKHH